jgi:hypothetical protein
LVKLPSSLGIGGVKPVPATAEMSTEPEQAVSGLQQVLSSTEKQGFQGNLPTYTAG